MHATQSCLIPPPIHQLTHTQHPHMLISLTPTHTSSPKQTKPYREIRPASTWLTLICSVNIQYYEPIETACLAVALGTELHTFPKEENSQTARQLLISPSAGALSPSHPHIYLSKTSPCWLAADRLRLR